MLILRTLTVGRGGPPLLGQENDQQRSRILGNHQGHQKSCV